MPEILLHYIWQKRLFADYPQQTTDGRRIEVISTGQHNLDAGPDFSNVHLRIDGQEWVGNIEIHVHSSDWYRHHHDQDRAYDNVILHVVREADREVLNSHGETITQCVLAYPNEQDYLTGLVAEARMMDSALSVHECGRKLLSDPQLLSEGWKNSLISHRLHCKSESIQRLLQLTQQDWEQAFYISLAHYFGFHTNGIPFEQLAIETPLRYLQKHRNSLFQLTAILLGQSGLLETSDSSNRDSLLREYNFLRKKFSLTPLDAKIWKRSRMRPQAFPEVRIRQFAHLLYQSEWLFSRLMEVAVGDRNENVNVNENAACDRDKIQELMEVFRLQAVDAEQYPGLQPAPQIGDESIRTLIINTIIPFCYAKGYHDQAIRLLESMPAEKNNIVRQWQLLGQKVQNAADSQALIHLYLNYCSNSQCLNCDVAYQIFLRK